MNKKTRNVSKKHRKHRAVIKAKARAKRGKSVAVKGKGKATGTAKR